MIYSGTILSKNNHQVPVYTSGKPAHSKYNPQSDMIPIDENFCGLLIVAGIAGGFHIQNLLNNKGIQKIIAVEADDESLSFALDTETIETLKTDKRISFCSVRNLHDEIIRQYIPSLYKNLTLVFLRSWQIEVPDTASKIKDILSSAIDSISSDFSVQAHFGKLWHRNILLNLKFISDTNFQNKPPVIPNSKIKSAVIAAGPSLDNSVDKLRAEKDSTYIIATDTAYGTLLGYGITPDAVVSVDSQHVSSEHFFCAEKSPTLFVLDLSANPETVRFLYNKGNRIFFIRSNHPLSSLIAKKFPIPLAETGSGTVTIAAADWAKKNGFGSIDFYGADFAYSDGKPYCRGTYLEKKFNSNSFRNNTSEKQYASLMFRTELKKQDKSIFGNLGKSPVTSKILESYGTTLMEWANRSNYRKAGTTLISNENFNEKLESLQSELDYKSFISNYIAKVKKLHDLLPEMNFHTLTQTIVSDETYVSLLPLFAEISGKDTAEDISIALHFLLHYNM